MKSRFVVRRAIFSVLAGVVAVSWIILVVIPMLNPRHIRNMPRDFCYAVLIYSLPLITIGTCSKSGVQFTKPRT